ncbi:unnamed protein product [Protopolystoma xenopodis]|uniref:BRCT domain-containing protein n=1 Tax=Protopolystoma xenopodis TaxID=117903 RepID=A0A3S5C5N7_9PLAT|nr:unnamed protein product [Protopolystoma xenopodis]
MPYPQTTRSNQFLSDVIAYVDIPHEVIRQSVIDRLNRLGANISVLGPKVTHIIFKHGSNETKLWAQRHRVYLVDPAWIKACFDQMKRVLESLFAVKEKEDTDQINYFSVFNQNTNLCSRSLLTAFSCPIAHSENSPKLIPLYNLDNRILHNSLAFNLTPPYGIEAFKRLIEQRDSPIQIDNISLLHSDKANQSSHVKYVAKPKISHVAEYAHIGTPKNRGFRKHSSKGLFSSKSKSAIPKKNKTLQNSCSVKSINNSKKNICGCMSNADCCVSLEEPPTFSSNRSIYSTRSKTTQARIEGSVKARGCLLVAEKDSHTNNDSLCTSSWSGVAQKKALAHSRNKFSQKNIALLSSSLSASLALDSSKGVESSSGSTQNNIEYCSNFLGSTSSGSEFQLIS